MTVYTLEVFKVSLTHFLKGGDYVFMARSASVSRGLLCPDVHSRFMWAVTCQAVLDGEVVSVLLVAVSTGVVPALFQAMTCMTVVAVLLGVGTGKFLQVFTRLRMTGDAAWCDIFEFGKVCDNWCMRIVASLAVLEGEVFLVRRVMAHTAPRNDYFTCRRMPLVTVKAPDLVSVG